MRAEDHDCFQIRIKGGVRILSVKMKKGWQLLLYKHSSCYFLSLKWINTLEFVYYYFALKLFDVPVDLIGDLSMSWLTLVTRTDKIAPIWLKMISSASDINWQNTQFSVTCHIHSQILRKGFPSQKKLNFRLSIVIITPISALTHSSNQTRNHFSNIFSQCPDCQTSIWLGVFYTLIR